MREEKVQALYFVDEALIDKARAKVSQKNQARFLTALEKYRAHTSFANLYLVTRDMQMIGDHLRRAEEMKKIIERIAEKN